jgi:hypothetical protein
MSHRALVSVIKAGFAFWLLLSPGENWTWVIVGGHERQLECEQARNERLDSDYLVCAATPAWTAVQPITAKGPGPERGPSPGLADGKNVGR